MVPTSRPTNLPPKSITLSSSFQPKDFHFEKDIYLTKKFLPFLDPHRTLRWQKKKEKSYQNSLSLATKPTSQSTISTLSQVLSPARCMSVTWEKNKIFVLAPAGSGKLRLHTPNHISNKVRTTTNTITPISPRKHATHKNSCACCCCCRCRLHFPWWLNCPSSPCHIKHTEFDYE